MYYEYKFKQLPPYQQQGNAEGLVQPMTMMFRLGHVDLERTAAWLRAIAGDAAPWSPAPLSNALAATEGWTFGII